MKRKMKEIEQLLQVTTELSEELLLEIKRDDRVGVQKAYAKWLAKKEKQSFLRAQFKEMNQYEDQLREMGINYIAGIDEVGRGPLAGPVVCAAVILPKDFELLGLTDSKKVSLKNREEFYTVITSEALAIGVAMVSASEIDAINIYEATKLGMKKAIEELTISPEHLLIDAMKLSISIDQTSIIKGDSKSVSIAASSIVAKVTRDRYMEQLAKLYPQYGFEKHMGYGTSEHLAAIDQYGPCPEHRKTFAPIKNKLSLTTLF